HALVHNVAPSGTTVLVIGEPGTGKTEIARIIHSLSSRADKPFVSMHGVDGDVRAQFEHAAGGTLVLDEIGELTASIQTELLHIIQEKLFDVRVIAITEKDLAEEVRANRFREDLY